LDFCPHLKVALLDGGEKRGRSEKNNNVEEEKRKREAISAYTPALGVGGDPNPIARRGPS